jgi:DNA polymerase-3 subunit gamma/tau
MSYTVLARKYRSQTFDDVVGQDAVAKTLKNAIKSGRVAHAYLFCGTRGVGKTTMARILAKALNCLSFPEPTPEPCCRCDSCVAVSTGEDIDVLEIDGASNNGVDNVRELRDNAIYRPARSRTKIYIIDEVHMLSTQAFNALLKILEEPPSHVKFIFATTEPNKVLATIQSRCQRFDFRNISVADIVSRLKAILKDEGIPFEEDLVLVVAKMANGSMRDALSLLDRLISVGEPLAVDLLEQYLGQPSSERIYRLVDAIGQGRADLALCAIDDLLVAGLSELQVADCLVDAMRDLLVLKTAGAETSLVILTADQLKAAQALASRFDAPALVYGITAMEKLRWPIKNTDTPRPLLEATILRLALSEHFLDAQTLLNHLASPGAEPKKKHTPEVRTPASPVARPPVQPTPADMPQPAVPAGGAGTPLDLRHWSDVLKALEDRLGKGTVTLLVRAVPLQRAPGVLVLRFEAGAKMQCQMAQANGRPEQLAKALTEILGQQTRVLFELTDEPQQPPAAQPKAASPGQPRAQGRKILDDPAVKTVLLGLDATITGVEEQQ